MTNQPARAVEAAGGVVWRPAADAGGIVIALVHRPRYDDWSVPKGKLLPGEHPLLGALREVREETGHVTTPGRPLGEVTYDTTAGAKHVRYWALRAEVGLFTPSKEVDQLLWLPPRQAQHYLSSDRDSVIVSEFMRDPQPTWPCLLVRHGTAGEPSAWPGADADRPLDDVGRAQAEALVEVLEAHRVRRVLSADLVRCLETVAPYAARQRITVEQEPLLADSLYPAAPQSALQRVLGLIDGGDPVVACSQRKTMPELIQQICRAYDIVPPTDTTTDKGGYWVAHFARNGDVRLAGLERFDPLVQPAEPDADDRAATGGEPLNTSHA
jgi:8-oxo-(d)GTP phosphatase